MFQDVRPEGHVDREWLRWAVGVMHSEQQRTADTHLRRVALPWSDVTLYFKMEESHPTGSLKHRLARSLFLYHLCNGAIGPDTTVVEASSGSTAVSEAYFARLLGLRFIAVMPQNTSKAKVGLVEREGAVCRFVSDAQAVYAEAARLAAEGDGLYLDQFTYAERATDWRGNNNIAESIFAQMAAEDHPEPRWIVVGAGTGGTSATLGRYIRYRGYRTELAVVDPEGSAFLEGFRGESGASAPGSRIEGIGRPRVEPSFEPRVIDRMLRIPDEASIAAIRFLAQTMGITAGPSTGTNLYASLFLACEMHTRSEAGSIVTLACDSSDRYASTYLQEEWVAAQGWDPAPYRRRLERAWSTGDWVA